MDASNGQTVCRKNHQNSRKGVRSIVRFKAKARVLLELGAELISSDQIALYELVKNAVDAGSPKIQVRFQIALTRSAFDAVLSKIESVDGSISAEFIEEELDAHLSNLPEDLLCEITSSLPGLDSEAGSLWMKDFYRTTSCIEVEDWGHGMSRADIEDKFLTIGTTHRLKQKNASDAPVLGEKGIGRLSCMRLGRTLELTSATATDTHWEKLAVDWDELAKNIDLDLEDFSVEISQGTPKATKGRSGTNVRISYLEADWDRDRVERLVIDEFAKLQDPFNKKLERLDLEITFNERPFTIRWSVDPKWLNKWHGHFEIELDYVEVKGKKQPRLVGKAEYKPPASSPISTELDVSEISAIGDDVGSLTADPDSQIKSGGQVGGEERFAGLMTLGPFRAEGYWWNRQRIRNDLQKQGPELANEFTSWLTRWAGGLLMYRDGYRVYPYASPEDDWLKLDQKALRGRAYKLNRGQLVGYVRISSRGNRRLIDQTNRQGLVDNPEKEKLEAILKNVIWRELGVLVKRHETKQLKISLESFTEVDKTLRARSKEARKQVTELAVRVPKEEAALRELKTYVDHVDAAWKRAKDTIKRQAEAAEDYLHLAGVGLLLEFLVHEINRATKVALDDLKSLKGAALSPALSSLLRQLKTLEKRLRLLDPVATPGRQRRTDVLVVGAVRTLLDAHESQFERHAITADLQVKPSKGDFESYVVEGYVYQIFENLIANSVYWLGNRRAYLKARQIKKEFDPTIEISVDVATRVVEFRDNGPGIDVADAPKIYDVFFSKKPDNAGRGLGLTIVRRLCDENFIKLELLDPDEDDRISGFRFTFPSSKQ